jgi:cytoskeleton protein RodZ
MRARIDVSEIEAKTKIRAKYLRALENEEWGLLPGPTFVKSFLRTYAQALDLDGKALVEEYRLQHEHPSEAMLEPIVSTPQSRRAPRREPRRGRPSGSEGPSRAYVLTVGSIGVVIVALIALLIVGGKSGTGKTTSSVATTKAPSAHSKHHAASTPGHRSVSPNALVALSLKPTGVVYVCLIGDNGRKLIPGVNLQPGETTPTYRAKRFEMTLGNNAVTLIVDGIPRTVAPSSEPIGYTLTKAYGRQPLTAAQRPACT